VPLIVVSTYSPQAGYIKNGINDFGSVLRAIEGIFNLPGGEGALNFADARAKNDLHRFFNFNLTPTSFTTIPVAVGSELLCELSWSAGAARHRFIRPPTDAPWRPHWACIPAGASTRDEHAIRHVIIFHLACCYSRRRIVSINVLSARTTVFERVKSE
jgi:hypothetical protein